MPIQDGTIIKKQIHSYSPYTSNFGPNDELRICIQSQDLYVLPSESYIFMEVEVTRKAGTENSSAVGVWSSNPAAYFFSEMRYEINNVQVDQIKNPGTCGNMKRLAAYPGDKARITAQQHFYVGKNLSKHQYMMIPLDQLFGFCDDYNKIILNAKHELILVRSRVDDYTYSSSSDSFNIKVVKIQWRVPHVQLSDHAKLTMLKYLEKKQSISVPYRSWDFYEMPQLPLANKHIWTVKSTTQMSRPRFVLVSFQTNKQTRASDSSTYSNCNISDVRLYLNSEYYPYENYNTDFNENNWHELCLAFNKIQKSYYNGRGGINPYDFSYESFGQNPIFAFDCSRTDESLIGGTVDVRLEINARANIPENTVANCVIIYDNQFEYSPFSGIVIRRT